MSITNTRREDRPVEYGKICVIDVEAFATTTRAVLPTVGIAIIGKSGNLLYSEEFFLPVNVQVEKLDRDSDSKTLAWWQQPERRKMYDRMLSAGFAMTEVDFLANLLRIAKVLENIMCDKYATIWGNSPAFDLGNLSSLFKDFALKIPWEYWQEQDYRTAHRIAKNLGFINRNTNMQPHNAEADAVYEAQTISDITAYLQTLKINPFK